jgi:hypothetical protein
VKLIQHSPQIRTKGWSDQKSLLLCPRCGSDYLHHTGLTVFDRGEDADRVTQTDVSGGKVSINPNALGANNPSSRRDGITIDFWCEACGDDQPVKLTLAQHKGNTEIGWVYELDD